MGWLRTDKFMIYEGSYYESLRVPRFRDPDLIVAFYVPNAVTVVDQTAAAWFKVVDGWEKDGNWGGYLQIACETHKGRWLGSDGEGWATTKSSRSEAAPVRFVDKDDYYEIWHEGKNLPLRVSQSSGALRFGAGAESAKHGPSQFNVKDA